MLFISFNHISSYLIKLIVIFGLEYKLDSRSSTFMAPYLHQFSIVLQKMYYKWCKFRVTIENIDAGTATSSKGAISNQFSEQH